MTTIPKVPNITLDPSPRARCVGVDGKRSAGRKALRHPPSNSDEGWKKAKYFE
jgi:hypothetical protein